MRQLSLSFFTLVIFLTTAHLWSMEAPEHGQIIAGPQSLNLNDPASLRYIGPDCPDLNTLLEQLERVADRSSTLDPFDEDTFTTLQLSLIKLRALLNNPRLNYYHERVRAIGNKIFVTFKVRYSDEDSAREDLDRYGQMLEKQYRVGQYIYEEPIPQKPITQLPLKQDQRAIKKRELSFNKSFLLLSTAIGTSYILYRIASYSPGILPVEHRTNQELRIIAIPLPTLAKLIQFYFKSWLDS